MRSGRFLVFECPAIVAVVSHQLPSCPINGLAKSSVAGIFRQNVCWCIRAFRRLYTPYHTYPDVLRKHNPPLIPADQYPSVDELHTRYRIGRNLRLRRVPGRHRPRPVEQLRAAAAWSGRSAGRVIAAVFLEDRSHRQSMCCRSGSARPPSV